MENMKIKNIIKDDGRTKSYKEMVQETGPQIDMMKWNSISSAIPKEWKS